MDFLKHLVESYLNIPPAGPGQKTSWNFTWKHPWPEWLPPGIVLLLAGFLIGLIIMVYLRDASRVSPRGRFALITLRLSLLTLLVFFLSELTLVVDLTGKPYVVVLIDDSASMQLEDQYSDQALEASVRDYLTQGNHEKAARLNLAKSVLSANDGHFLKQLVRDHKLRVYRFSDLATLLGENEYLEEDDIEELLPSIEALSATGEQTRPGPAVKQVLNDFRGSSPSAIIVISDGIASTTEADKLSSASNLALSKLVPIFTLAVGSEEPARDLQLYDLRVDEVAFVDDPIVFSATVKGFSFEGQQASVVLKDKDTQRVLERKLIEMGPDGKPQAIEVTHIPTVEGEFDYVLEITPMPGETNRDNNSETRHVSVRREKIHVLLVDSAPRYEFRYLKNLLERDHTIILHSVLLDADENYAFQDESARPLKGRFPTTREALFTYDVIIFGDVNHTELHSEVLQHLHDFVHERGGGVIFIAGELYNPLSYVGSKLENLLPVQLKEARRLDQENIAQSFRPKLTIQGKKGTSIFRFDESELESQRIWNQLPELFWYVKTPNLRETAVALAEHPTEPGADGRLPIIVKQQLGKGMVIFHATDELWRWRFRVGDLYYRRYWVQAIRYLTISRLLGKTHSAVLETDRREYQQGDQVKLWVRFLDERRIPPAGEKVRIMVEREGDFRIPLELTRLQDAPTVFEGTFRQTQEGGYRAWVVSPSFPEAPPSRNFRVVAPDQELRVRSLDRADLTRTATVTRGGYYTLANAEQIPEDIPSGELVTLETQDPVTLWNRWEFLLLFTALLSGEWLLRKRYHLI